jgi:hypothetical protein
MIFVGHDPGKSGAVAAIDEHKRVLALGDVPLALGEVDGLAFSKLFPVGAIVCIEKNHSRSHEDKHGRRVVPASDFSFGRVSGIAEGICYAKGIVPHMVSPQSWQRTMLLGLPARNTKDASIQMAKRLFPSTQSMLYGPRGGEIHGRADALLLAEFCRRNWRIVADRTQTPLVVTIPAMHAEIHRGAYRGETKA